MALAAGSTRPEDPAPPRVLVDVGVAAALGTLGSLLIWSGYQAVPAPPPVPAAVLSAVLLYVPLVWWRRRPLVALPVVTVGFLIGGHYAVPEGVIVLVALFVAFVGAGAYGDDRWRTPVRAAVVLVLVAQVLVPLLAPELYRLADGSSLARQEQTLLWGITFGLYNLLYFVAAWLLGDVLRIRKLRERELAARTAELEIEREENARRAVVEERLRISRELHDVVAHHLSIIGLQAGAAQRALSRDPQRTRQALSVVESSSRAAVEELQRLLLLLRDDGSAGRAPQPSLDSLPELAAQVAPSLEVRLTVEGEPRPVPTSVGVSAYRVAQEALTNTLRHASAASRAELTVRYRGEALEVEVVDDGRGEQAASSGRGFGLTGMHERVAMHRGDLVAGPHDAGGFRVRARFPLPAQPASHAAGGV